MTVTPEEMNVKIKGLKVDGMPQRYEYLDFTLFPEALTFRNLRTSTAKRVIKRYLRWMSGYVFDHKYRAKTRKVEENEFYQKLGIVPML